MKKVIIIAFIAIVCCAVVFWMTIETNPEIATSLGFASGPGKPDEIANVTPSGEETVVGGDLIPMVFVDGTLYCDIGEESTITARCGMMDGEITSTVNQNEEPFENDQSNFGTGYGYQYGPNRTIEILIDGKWCVFAIMADAV